MCSESESARFKQKVLTNNSLPLCFVSFCIFTATLSHTHTHTHTHPTFRLSASLLSLVTIILFVHRHNMSDPRPFVSITPTPMEEFNKRMQERDEDGLPTISSVSSKEDVLRFNLNFGITAQQLDDAQRIKDKAAKVDLKEHADAFVESFGRRPVSLVEFNNFRAKRIADIHLALTGCPLLVGFGSTGKSVSNFM